MGELCAAVALILYGWQRKYMTTVALCNFFHYNIMQIYISSFIFEIFEYLLYNSPTFNDFAAFVHAEFNHHLDFLGFLLRK